MNTLLHFLFLAFYAVAVAQITDELSIIQYRNYLQKFGKHMDRLLDVNRIQTFTLNYARLMKHNLCSYSSNLNNASCYQLQLTEFSDWLVEEIEQFFVEAYSEEFKVSRNLVDDRSRRILPNSDRLEDGNAALPTPAVINPISMAFPKELNWASAQNSVGRSVVSPVRNQGGCGACWAFVAITTTESSIRVAVARKIKPLNRSITASIRSFRGNRDRKLVSSGAFIDDSPLRPPHLYDTGKEIYYDKVRAAELKQSAATASSSSLKDSLLELKGVFLSQQELIDCDTSDGNQGCHGGRPSLAFRYLQNYGVTTLDRYPFFGEV